MATPFTVVETSETAGFQQAMSLINSLRGDANGGSGGTLAEKIETAKNLREVFDKYPPNEYRQFLMQFLPVTLEALRMYPAQLMDSEHNLYRAILVEIITRLPQNEILREFIKKLGDICLFVIETDLEDNATKCIRVFFELIKNFRTQLKDMAPRLLDFLCKLYERFDETVKTRFSSMLTPQQDPTASGMASSSTPQLNPSMSDLSGRQQPLSPRDQLQNIVHSPRGMPGPATGSQMTPSAPLKNYVYACNSFKVMSECPMIVMNLFQAFKEHHNHYARELIPNLLNVISTPHMEISNQLQNKQVYSDFRAAQVKTLSFLTYFLRNFSDLIVPHQERIGNSIVSLLDQCPDNLSMRKELLAATRHIVATEELGRGLFKRIDNLLDENVILGRGLACHEHLRPIAGILLYDLIHPFRMEITFHQLSRTILMSARNVQDSSLPLSTQIVNLRLVFNLIESIFTRCSKKGTEQTRKEGRRLVSDIHYTFVTKLGEMAEDVQSLIEREEKLAVNPNDDPRELSRADRQAAEQVKKEILETKQLLNYLIRCMKAIIYAMTNLNLSPAQPQDPKLSMIPHSGNDKFLWDEELRRNVRLVRYGVKCLKVFRDTSLPKPPSQNPGKMQNSFTEFADIFSSLQENNFKEVFSPFPTLHLLYTSAFEIDAFFKIFEHLLSPKYKLHSAMVELLLDFLINHQLDDLNQPDGPKAKLYLRLFKLIEKLIVQVDTIGPLLQPHVSTILDRFLQAAKSQGNPSGYCQLLLILFQAVTKSKGQVFYKEFPSYLQRFLSTIDFLLSTNHEQALKEKLIEIVLLLPVRLDSLLPYLKFLMNPLLLALKSGNVHLTRLGLNTFTFWVDSLNPEFLQPEMASLEADLLRALWNLVRPPPFPFGQQAFLLLGKIGGGARRSSDFTTMKLEHKTTLEHGVRIGLCFQLGKPLILPMDRSVSFAISKVLGKSENEFDSNGTSAGLEIYYRRCALAFLRTYMCGVLNITNPESTIPKTNGQFYSHLKSSAAQANHHRTPQKSSQTTDNTLIKTKTMLKAEESTFCQIAEAVIIGSFELENQPDLNDDGTSKATSMEQASVLRNYLAFEGFVPMICRHMAFVFAVSPSNSSMSYTNYSGSMHTHHPTSIQPYSAEEINPLLFVEALINGIGRPNPKHSLACLQALNIFVDQCLELYNSQLYNMHIAKELVMRLTHGCLSIDIAIKEGCLKALKSLLPKILPFCAELEYRLFKGFLSALKGHKNLSPNIFAEVKSALMWLVEKVRIEALKIPTHPNQSQQPVRNSVIIEVLEAAFNTDSTKQLRSLVFEILHSITRRTGMELTRVLRVPPSKFIINILRRSFRQFPPEGQISVVQILKFSLQSRPPLLAPNDPHVESTLIDALHLAEEDESTEGSMTAEQKDIALELKISCVELLVAFLPLQSSIAVEPRHNLRQGASQTQPPSEDLRIRVIMLLLKLLGSGVPELVRLSSQKLKDIKIRNFDHNTLIHPLRPMLSKLEKANLSLPLLEGLQYVLELVSPNLHQTFGDKLLSLLSSRVTEYRAQYQDANNKITVNDVKICAATIKLLHLFPKAYSHSQMGFTEKVVTTVYDLEKVVNSKTVYSSRYSPFRAPFVMYLARNPVQTIEIIFKRILTPKVFHWFLDLLRLDEALPIREEICKNPQQIVSAILDYNMPKQPSSSLPVEERSLAKNHVIQLTRLLVKLHPEWLKTQRALFDELLKLWGSTQRMSRLSSGEEIPHLEVRETKWLLKCILNYILHDRRELNLIFEIATVLTYKCKMYFGFVKKFFLEEVARKFSWEERKQILNLFLRRFQKQLSSNQRTACLRFITNPILEHIFEEKSPDRMKIFDPDMVEQILTHLFDTREEVFQEYSEATRVELLKLSTLLLKNIPEELIKFRKELLSFGWKHTKREEELARQWALVNLCQFTESFQVPETIVVQTYGPLLKMFQHEFRPIAQKALDILIPLLPTRFATKTDNKYPGWIRIIKRVMLEDSNSLLQAVLILHIIIKHESLFYPSREQIVPQMVFSISRLGLAPNTLLENRKLAVEVAGLIIKWDETRLSNAMGRSQPHGEMRDLVGSKRGNVGDLFEASSSKRAAVEIDGSRVGIPPRMAADIPQSSSTGNSSLQTDEWAPSSATCDTLCHFLTRIALMLASSERRDDEFVSTLKYSLSLLQRSLRIWSSVLSIKPQIFERLIEQSNMSVSSNINAMLQVMKIFIEGQGVPFVSSNGKNILTLLEIGMDSKSLQIQNTMISYVQALFKSFSDVQDQSRLEVRKNLLVELNKRIQDLHPGRVLQSNAPNSEIALNLPQTMSAQKSDDAVSFSGFVAVFQCATKFAPTIVSEIMHAVLKQLQKWAKDYGMRVKAEWQSGTSLGSRLSSKEELPKDFTIMLESVASRLPTSTEFRKQFMTILSSLIPDKHSNLSAVRCVARAMRNWMTALVEEKRAPLNTKETDKITKEVLSLLKQMVTIDKTYRENCRQKSNAPITKDPKGDEDRNEHQTQQEYSEEYHQWKAELLSLLYFSCSHERLPDLLKKEVFTKIEQVHMLGFSCSDPDLRFNFLSLYNRSMSQTPLERLRAIFQSLDWSEIADTFWIKQALSLLLCALKSEIKIEMPPHSSVVPSVTYRIQDILTPPGAPDITNELKMQLESEMEFLKKAFKLKMGNIIYPLQELSFHNAYVTDQLWVLILPALWSTLEKADQYSLVKPITSLLEKSYNETQNRLYPNVLQTMLEGISSFHPQPRVSSESIRYIAKKCNGWYLAASALHCHIALNEMDNRCADSLSEIYKLLGEEDTLVGLWNSRSERQETKIGLFMDQQVALEEAQELWYQELCKDPRPSENQPISRSEFCLWESKWIEAAKELSQWEALRDLAKDVDNKDLLLESLWKIGPGDWRAVDECLNTRTAVANGELGTLEAQEICLIRAYAAVHNNNIDEAEKLRNSLIEQSLKIWSEYPKMGMTPRLKLLMNAQRIVELGESLRVITEMNSPTGEQNTFPTLREVMETWRLRLPNFWDKFSHWQDVLIWRNHMYNLIIRKLDSYETLSPVLYSLGYHNKAWGVNKLGATARKHGFPAVAEYVLNNMYGYLQMEVQEAFVKLREQAKAFLCNSGEFQKGLNILRTANLDYFQSTQQKAEIFRLKGEFFQRMGDADKARECFTEALSLHNHLPKGWLSFGYHCDNCFSSTGQPIWLEYAVACYLQAVKYGTSKARVCLPRILMLLSFKDSTDHEQGRKVSDVISRFLDSTHLWMWLVWIPQLLMSLHRMEGDVTKEILARIVRFYPQALYYHLRTFFLEKRPSQNRADSSGSARSPQADATHRVAKDLMESLKTRHNNFVNELEPTLTDITIRLVPKAEERLIAVVYNLLARCYRHMAKSDADVPDSVKKELENTCRACFGKDTAAKHSSFAEMYRERFERDLNPESKEFAKTLGELINCLKKWISWLQNNMEQTLPSVLRLEDECRSMGSVRRYFELEIPGQYLADQELSSDSVIKLEAFGMDVPIVRRHGSSHRRLTMLGSDGKMRSFLIQTSLVPGVLSEERSMQLMRAFNQQLLRRKDTRSRNLIYYCPNIVHVHPQVRIIDDDASCITLGEIFEIFCERHGREADAPIITFKDRIYGTRDPNDSIKVKREAFQEIGKNLVADSILLQHMYKIFPTSHHFWTFKKKFCLQLALSGLMGYLLRIGNRQPKNILISMETANVFHSEFQCIYDETGIVDNREAVPFRLTRNIVSFISPFAVEGTFETCLVAGAKALQSPRPGGRSAGGPLANKLHLTSLLGLYFKDEIIWWGQRKHKHMGQPLEDKGLEQKVEMNIRIVLQNIDSLAPKNNLKADYTQVYEKAQTLVSEAQNIDNLCQMDAVWHPWF